MLQLTFQNARMLRREVPVKEEGMCALKLTVSSHIHLLLRMPKNFRSLTDSQV